MNTSPDKEVYITSPNLDGYLIQPHLWKRKPLSLQQNQRDQEFGFLEWSLSQDQMRMMIMSCPVNTC